MDEFEVIKGQMETRRSSLADKLEALEQQVSDSVQEVTSAVNTVTEVVQGTVESVKDSVQETVDSVKDSVHDTVGAVRDTFDFAHHMEHHPMICLAGAFGLGFLGGCIVPKEPSKRQSDSWDRLSAASERPNGASHGNYRAQSMGRVNIGAPTQADGQPATSWLQGLGSILGPEIDKLKGLAVATVLGLVRDKITQAVPPEVGSRLKDVIDDVTTRLGTLPLRENLAGKETGNNYHFSDAR